MLTLVATRRFWLKLIRVRPGHRTSLQLHHHRDEWHLSLDGLRFIPAHTLHRMTAGFYLELARGMPDESDIERVSDDYGRDDKRRL